MSKKMLQSTLIEVVIPASTTPTKIMIPDQPDLRDCKIWWMQAYCDQQVLNSPLSNNVACTKTDLQSCYITLQDYGGTNFINQAPLVQFQTIENNMTYVDMATDVPPTIQEKDFKSLNGQFVNWPKSWIQFAPAAASGVVRSVLIEVMYEDPAYTNKKPSKFENKK